MHNMILLDDTDDFACQLTCEVSIMDTLHKLAALVAASSVSMEERAALMQAITHIRGHIMSETARLSAEQSGRLN